VRDDGVRLGVLQLRENGEEILLAEGVPVAGEQLQPLHLGQVLLAELLEVGVPGLPVRRDALDALLLEERLGDLHEGLPAVEGVAEGVRNTDRRGGVVTG
jgi:hypothetical protein